MAEKFAKLSNGAGEPMGNLDEISIGRDIERYHEDEIDLAELFRKLWAKRLVILLAMLIGGSVGAGMLMASQLKHPLVTTAELEIRFNFPSIQNGTYPSGQRFSLNDLIAPAILNQVYAQYDLESLGLSNADFVESVQIVPHSTNREFIEARFKSRLGDKKLSAAEIQELNKNYAAAIEAANQRFAKLSFTLNASLAVPSEVMKQVLMAIPTVWAQESIESYGVLDIPLADIGELDVELINSYEYFVAVQYLENYRKLLDRSAQSLRQDEVGRLLVDPNSGLGADEILSELSNPREFHINVIQRSFAMAPTARNRQMTKFYLENQLIIENEKLDQLQRKAAIVDQAYVQLRGGMRDKADLDLAVDKQRGYPTQYGDEFLTRLMSIGDELAESEYKKTLLDRSIDMKLRAEDVITRIQQLEKNLQIFESGRQDAENSTIEDKVESEIAYVTTQLQNLAFAINQLASMRSERILGRSGALYNVNNEPSISGNFRETVRSLVKFSALGAVAGLLLGFFTAFFLAVINLKRNRIPDPEPSN